MNTDNLRVKWIEVEASVWEAQQAELKALREGNERLNNWRNWWCPDVCPITGLPFFMWITHHETDQWVPTYGGPYDSYTIPVMDEDGCYIRECYEHDLGVWRVDEHEDVGVQIVNDQLYTSEEDPEKLKAQIKSLTELSDARLAWGQRLESQLAELRQGGGALAGFFSYDDQNDIWEEVMESHKNHDDVVPLYTRPQPAIPPGYAVPDTTDEWRKLALQYDAQRMLFRDLLKWVDKYVSCAMSDQIRQALASAPAIQPQAAVPIAEPEGKWQPIETAPRDKAFLAVLDCGGDKTVCTMRWAVAESKNSRPHGDFIRERVTHWMPLPAAPADSKEDSGYA